MNIKVLAFDFDEGEKVFYLTTNEPKIRQVHRARSFNQDRYRSIIKMGFSCALSQWAHRNLRFNTIYS